MKASRMEWSYVGECMGKHGRKAAKQAGVPPGVQELSNVFDTTGFVDSGGLQSLGTSATPQLFPRLAGAS